MHRFLNIFFDAKFFLPLVFIGGVFSACKREYTPEQKPVEIIQLNWSKNKGYILRNEGIHLLKKLALKKPELNSWRLLHKSDTIGKYIKSPGTQHYVFCIWDPEVENQKSAHFLVEAKHIKEHSFEIIAKERYIHGETVGCWENHYDGLQVHYDYFTFQYCRGKEGFSAVDHYYFTYVIPQEELKTIPDKFAMTNKETAKLMAAKKEYFPRGIQYQYRYETFSWKNGQNIQEQKLDSFNIYYDLDGTLWTASTNKHNNKFK